MAFTPLLPGALSNQAEEYSSPEDQDENYDDIRKKLLFTFVPDTPRPENISKKDTVQVYLRVRPKNTLELALGQPECFHLTEGGAGNELIAIAPKTSQTYKNKTTSQNKYTFTKIFDPSTTQHGLFEESLLPTIKDFFDGQNCLVFTYGVTNSGKTYTVSGTPSNPGLLPRALDVVFNSIQEQKLLTDVKFQPKHYSEVTNVTEGELLKERLIKDTLLDKARDVDQTSPSLQALDETDVISEHDISSVSTISKASSNLSKLTDDGMSFEMPVHDSSSVDLDSSGQYYSVWVSFAEIYNEFIYDLLGDPPVKGKPRPALKLQEDKNHNQFIRGLREIQVGSVDEAMLMLKFGLQHRHVAATRLNYHSSRSHSIYTIKLIKVASPNKPRSALVNRISIVDLAGSERSAKTGATGARVKEAGQINKSLLTLGKCIDAMKYNQLKKCGDEHVVPFRESKLTRLFQNYFVGKGGKGVKQGKITMFVNISNSASVFDETMHVLKFSALTSKVIPLVKCLPDPTPRKPKPSTNLPPPTPSTLTHTHTRSTLSLCSSEEAKDDNRDNTNSTDCQKCKHLQGELEQCLRQANAKVSSLEVKLVEQEYMIRQEVCREFNEQLVEIEDNHSRELEMQAEEIEEMYEKRMKNLQKSIKKQYTRKRRRQDDDDDDEPSEQRLQAVVVNLKERNKELEEELALERNRAAAEVQDAAESHETRVVRLNQQLAEKCIQLTESQRTSNQLQEQSDNLTEQLSSIRQEMAKLSSENVILRMEQEKVVGGLKTEVETLQGELSRQSDDGESVLMAQLETLREQLSTSHNSNDDAQAEVEILTTRISELTKEMEEMEAGKNELKVRLGETTSNSEDATELCSSLQEDISSLQSQLSDLQQLLTTNQTELTSVRQTHTKEREDWQAEMEAISKAKTEKVAFNVQVEALQGSISDEKASLQALKEAHANERATLHGEIDTLKEAQIAEKAKFQEEIDTLKQTHMTDKANWASEIDSLEEAQIAEKAEFQEEVDNLKQTVTDKANWASETDSLKQAHVTEKASLEEKMDLLNKAHTTDKVNWQSELETLKNEVSSMSAKVLVKNEQIYKIESEKEEQERQTAALKNKLERKLAEISDLNTQKDSLSCDVKRTLLDYETTLKNQSSRIQELERENELTVSQSEELAQQCTDLELRMSRTVAVKAALSDRVEELTNSLEDSRKALSQRESELLDTSDQCRAVLEDQIADLKKQCATLEHELTTAREDGKSLQAALREKESELLSLAKSVSGDKAEVEAVNSQLEDITEMNQQQLQEHDRMIKEMQGNHQLEVAQLSIRVRELTEVLDSKTSELENMSQSYDVEVETVRKEWAEEVKVLNKQLQQAEKKLSKLAVAEAEVKSLKKSSQQLKKDCETKKKEVEKLRLMISSLEDSVRVKDQQLLKVNITHEATLQATKDEWRKEVEDLKSHRYSDVDPTYEELPDAPSEDPTLYDTVCDSSTTTVTSTESLPKMPNTVLKPVENRANSRRSYLQAMSFSIGQESVLDSSKPLLPILDSSSQLEDDSILPDDVTRVEIDATPLPLKKKRRKAAKKRSIHEAQGKENVTSPVVKKPKYALRNRAKQIKEECNKPEEETSSLQSFTPSSQKSFMKHFTTTGKKKRAAAAATMTPKSSVLEISSIATRTRRKKLRKSQISAPLELVDSPSLNYRNAIKMEGKGAQLGQKLRPVQGL